MKVDEVQHATAVHLCACMHLLKKRDRHTQAFFKDLAIKDSEEKMPTLKTKDGWVSNQKLIEQEFTHHYKMVLRFKHLTTSKEAVMQHCLDMIPNKVLEKPARG